MEVDKRMMPAFAAIKRVSLFLEVLVYIVNRINRFRGILNRSAVERDRGNGHQAGWRQQRGESATQ